MDGRETTLIPLSHHFFKIAQAQIVGKVPAYAQQDHRLVKLTALEHRNPPKIINGFLAMLPVTKTLQQIHF
jgi:hypothetical protein